MLREADVKAGESLDAVQAPSFTLPSREDVKDDSLDEHHQQTEGPMISAECWLQAIYPPGPDAAHGPAVGNHLLLDAGILSSCFRSASLYRELCSKRLTASCCKLLFTLRYTTLNKSRWWRGCMYAASAAHRCSKS